MPCYRSEYQAFSWSFKPKNTKSMFSVASKKNLRRAPSFVHGDSSTRTPNHAKRSTAGDAMGQHAFQFRRNLIKQVYRETVRVIASNTNAELNSEIDHVLNWEKIDPRLMIQRQASSSRVHRSTTSQLKRALSKGGDRE